MSQIGSAALAKGAACAVSRRVECARTIALSDAGRLGEVVATQQASGAGRRASFSCVSPDRVRRLAGVTPRIQRRRPDRHARVPTPRRVSDGHLEIFFDGSRGEFPYLRHDTSRLRAWAAPVHGKEFTLHEPGRKTPLNAQPQRPSSRVHRHWIGERVQAASPGTCPAMLGLRPSRVECIDADAAVAGALR